MSLAIILLAAGQGTRMNSKKQKILHEVGGKPMLRHVFEAAEQAATMPPVVVIGVGGDGVRQLLGSRAQYMVQEKQMGTGHATMIVKSALAGQTRQVIVTYGDMPLLQADTMRQLAERQQATNAAIVMLTVLGDADSSFGRIARRADGSVQEIVEVAAARQRPNSADLLAIPELNAGVYCFDADWLWSYIEELPLRQARSGQEYYLTDMVEIAVNQGRTVEAIVTDDPDECLGAGTRQEIVAVEKAFRRRANRRVLDAGVTLVDPDSTFIDPDVVVGQDTVIWPNSYLQGNTVVGADCTIGPNTILRDAEVGDGCHLEQMVVEKTAVPAHTKGAPFTTLRSE